MRTLSESFCKRIHELIEKYTKENSEVISWSGNEDRWTKRMIKLVHEDWKDEKLTDVEFAHLVDNILCY